MPSASMARTVTRHETTGRTRRVVVSLPRISALEGDPAYQPQPADMRPARHRNPSMKTLVHWAMEAENAEALGRKLQARFERRKRRRTDAQLDAEVDRMLDRGRAE